MVQVTATDPYGFEIVIPKSLPSTVHIHIKILCWPHRPGTRRAAFFIVILYDTELIYTIY